MSFFNELKRRNVFRVGFAYAVVAWVLLQVVDLVLENIAAPDWVMKVFMLMLVVGFPVAVIIAWAFEVTPDGIKRESEVDRSQSIAPNTGHKLDRIIIAFLAIAVAFLLIHPLSQDTESGPTVPPTTQTGGTVLAEKTKLSPALAAPPAIRDKSVAVLPFAYRSNNSEDEFFAEGMHDDLLTQLAKIGSMKVISRTSVLEYKDTTKKIPQIARELGVATILEGGVQRSGSRIRFNAQLIDANTDKHLWAETYNRELTAENLFDIQAEIARAIAQALKATLSPDDDARLNQVLTKNLEAWKSYQRASQLSLLSDVDLANVAIAEVDQALKLDPVFAAAWSLKAILLMQQYWFFDNNPATIDAARDAIQRGRAINPGLADIDLAEAYYYYWGFRDYNLALSYIQKAAVAMPNDARVHQGRAYILRRMGDWENSLAAFNRANELDPRNHTTLSDSADTLTQLKRFDQARSFFDKAEEINPSDANGIWEKSVLILYESGDIASFAHLNHLMVPAHPEAQLDTWRSSLYADDYQAALQDVRNWQENFLNSKSYRLTRPILYGLTWLYSGDAETATPLLNVARENFKILLQKEPANYPILRSLCLISGGLGQLDEARQYCEQSLSAAPKDAYLASIVKFDAAAGLALAGDTQAAISLLKTMLDADAGPTMYIVIYHPAFDAIRQDPAYLKLLEQYGPKTNAPDV